MEEARRFHNNLKRLPADSVGFNLSDETIWPGKHLWKAVRYYDKDQFDKITHQIIEVGNKVAKAAEQAALKAAQDQVEKDKAMAAMARNEANETASAIKISAEEEFTRRKRQFTDEHEAAKVRAKKFKDWLV